MALKRTLLSGYTEKDSHFDRTQRRHLAGVTNGHNGPAHHDAREYQYEMKRRKFAKKSGIGARECARRQLGGFHTLKRRVAIEASLAS